MSECYQLEFKAKGDIVWVPWAEQYPSVAKLWEDWDQGAGLNTDEFDFRVVKVGHEARSN